MTHCTKSARLSRLTKLAVIAVVAGWSASLLTGCAAPGKPAEPKLSAEQREQNVAAFDMAWERIRDRYWDPTMGGIDWDAAKTELRPKVESAETMSAARAAMREMIARLGVSHFGIIPSEVYADVKADGAAASSQSKPSAAAAREGTAGMEVRVVNGAALVTELLAGLPAAQAGVQPGWEIVAIDGSALDKPLKKVAEEYATSSYKEFYLSRVVMNRLDGAVDTTVAVQFRDGQNRLVSHTLTRAQHPGKAVRLGNMPTVYVRFESRRLDPNVGYIAFSMFMDPGSVMPQFNDAMKSFLDANGVIIDLRGNPGGVGVMAMGMAGWLIKEKNRELGVMTTRETKLRFVVNPRAQTFDGPVAVLVDGLSMSTSEIFAGGLKDLGRVRIIGTPTPGAALPSTFERLPNGDALQYAFANYVSAGGEPLEGRGVKPDQLVEPSREALLAGQDPAVRAAIDWIAAQRRS